VQKHKILHWKISSEKSEIGASSENEVTHQDKESKGKFYKDFSISINYMDEMKLLPQPVESLMEVVGGEGLRYHVMAAYLIAICHDPSAVIVHEDYEGGATIENFYKQFLPFDDASGKFAPVDPLALLYEEGKKEFSRRGISPLEILQRNPLNQQEQECLDKLLSDIRIPYSRYEMYLRLVESDSLS
jgi:hypothetical protein